MSNLVPLFDISKFDVSVIVYYYSIIIVINQNTLHFQIKTNNID